MEVWLFVPSDARAPSLSPSHCRRGFGHTFHSIPTNTPNTTVYRRLPRTIIKTRRNESKSVQKRAAMPWACTHGHAPHEHAHLYCRSVRTCKNSAAVRCSRTIECFRVKFTVVATSAPRRVNACLQPRKYNTKRRKRNKRSHRLIFAAGVSHTTEFLPAPPVSSLWSSTLMECANALPTKPLRENLPDP